MLPGAQQANPIANSNLNPTVIKKQGWILQTTLYLIATTEVGHLAAANATKSQAAKTQQKLKHSDYILQRKPSSF